MTYLLHIGGRYYFHRRVPFDLKSIDDRKFIKTALRTDSRKEALRLVGIHNAQIEGYWKQLIESEREHTASADQTDHRWPV